MGKKYIIEIPEDKIEDFVGSTHFLMPYMMAGHIGHHDTGLLIEPYTEPDLEHVRKEAYEEGKKQAKVQAELDVCHDIEKVAKENYKAGLADAWDACRKICCYEIDGGYHVTHMLDLFDRDDLPKILSGYTATEAIEKLKTYEQEQEEIKVGDEVERILDGEVDSKAVFLEENKGYYHCLFWTGSFFTTLSYPKKQFRKTGRHFPEIAAVLEKMRGEQNVPETD